MYALRLADIAFTSDAGRDVNQACLHTRSPADPGCEPIAFLYWLALLPNRQLRSWHTRSGQVAKTNLNCRDGSR